MKSSEPLSSASLEIHLFGRFRVFVEGHIQVSDIVLSKPVSKESKSNAQLWAECIVGAEPVEVYLDLVRSAGFENVSIIDRLDYFARSSNEDTRNAADSLGAHTVVLTGKKA